VPALLFA